jgi:hypothetical protein
MVAAGKRAQVDREIPVATAAFNRALAYRPDNPELLRLVSGLAHTLRLRQTVRSGVIGLGITVVLAGLTYGAIRLFEAENPSRARGAATASAEVPPAGSERAAGERAPSEAEPRASASARPVVARKPRRLAQPRILSTQKRRVQVQILGATGGYVMVNGQKLAHGQFIDLNVGDTYSFKFRPPDEDQECCIPVEKTELIGPETSVISAEVAFRDAKIIATGAPDGSRIDCGIVGNGPALIGFPVRLTAEKPELQEMCSVIPPNNTEDPVTKEVRIRPGLTIDLWK